jgi:hypothetical protein
MLLEPALRRGYSPPSGEVGGTWFVRSTQAWLMTAMLIAAIAIS